MKWWRWGRWLVLLVLLVFLCGLVWVRITADLNLARIKLPRGFTLEVYAGGIEGPRSLALGDRGTVFVTTRGAGSVYAVPDANGDHRADELITIASGLNMPNGAAFRQGALYVAEVHRILRFDNIEDQLRDPPPPVVIRDDLPTEMWHGWRYIGFGPDDRLYVAIGAPCNVCEQTDERFGTIVRMNPDGSQFEIFARGVRNSVGFDWHPETGELWFTDNGRDWMGNHLPPDELNRAPGPGLHFGFPYCHGSDIADPDFGTLRRCDEFMPPVQGLDAHVASLGMRFYTGTMFPAEYRGQIFIAEHGSWNRMPPAGYRVTRVKLDGNRAAAYEVFASGWLRLGRGVGTPADLLILPDGSMLVSDDRANMIYRIAYAR